LNIDAKAFECNQRPPNPRRSGKVETLTLIFDDPAATGRVCAYRLEQGILPMFARTNAVEVTLTASAGGTVSDESERFAIPALLDAAGGEADASAAVVRQGAPPARANAPGKGSWFTRLVRWLNRPEG
jgi:hypothetical protein